ncbi:MAG: pyrroline-5-carboxylate reductase, partial [Thermoplasmata archaeon]
LVDAVTGLSGSGPAYVFLFAEALLSGALKVGLPHNEARELTVQTLKGATEMLEAHPEVHPSSLRDMVTTPGGTTIAALHELEKKGFRDAVISAVEAATRRSKELGKG